MRVDEVLVGMCYSNGAAILSESDLEFFTNEENWMYGPQLHLRLAFGDVQSALDAVPVLFSDQVVGGPFDEIADVSRAGCTGTSGVDSSVIRYCILKDDAAMRNPVGAMYYVRPSYGDWAVLWLAIPPRHVRRVCERYPWNWTTNWVTPGGFQLHSLLIELAMRLRKDSELHHTVIQDEAWPYGQSYGQSGIVVHHEIAKTGHWEIADEFETYCLLRFR